jgi:hypothetical protein
VPGTGETCNIYDYNALVRANGEKNATFAALEAFGGFMKENGWMQRASLASSLQLGFEWEATRAAGLDYKNQPLSLSQSWDFLQHGLIYGLFCSGHRPRLHPLDRPLDKNLPLLVASASAMSRKAQENIIDFVKSGGHAILIGALPETDLDYAPCTLLKEFCCNPTLVPVTTPALVVDAPEFGATIYNTSPVSGVAAIPDGAKLLARDTRRGAPMGYRLAKGSGSITWLGLQFMIRTFDQVEWMEQLLEIAGAKPLIFSSNRNVMTTLWEGSGKKCLFLMNLYASPQSTELTLYPHSEQSQNIGKIDLAAMEVKVLEL